MVVVLSVLFFAFEALSVVFCLHYLYGKKLEFDVMTVGFVAFDVIWMEVVHLLSLELTWTLMIYPIIVLYCGCKFGFKFRTILINNVLYIVILSGIQATIMLFFSLAFGNSRMEILDNLVINAIMFGIVVFGLKKCKLKKLSDTLQSPEKLVVISLIVVITGALIFLIGYKQKGSFEILYYIVLGVSIALIVIAAIDIGKHKIRAKEAEAELRIYKLYEPSFRELVEDIRARQHEFDNHINAINSLCYNHDDYAGLVEALGKYCGEIVKENRYNKLLSHGSHAVTSFLYSRFLEAEKRGIEVSYRVCIEELECGVPVHKLVELLGNLVNNAMDEAEKSGKGRIYVTLLEERERIRITVSNESEAIEYRRIPELFKRGYSEKGKNRGYGLYNVKKICEDYGIEISCDNKSIEGEDGLTFNLTIEKRA